jgi:predicted nuclease of predicted toxin-antitoxin system
MKFKLDENFPLGAQGCFGGAGFDCHTVSDEELVGGSDDRLIEICRKEGRILLSLDLDFADIVTYAPIDYAGIVVFRLSRQDAVFVLSRLTEVIPVLADLVLAGHLVIVNDSRVRYR